MLSRSDGLVVPVAFILLFLFYFVKRFVNFKYKEAFVFSPEYDLIEWLNGYLIYLHHLYLPCLKQVNDFLAREEAPTPFVLHPSSDPTLCCFPKRHLCEVLNAVLVYEVNVKSIQ